MRLDWVGMKRQPSKATATRQPGIKLYYEFKPLSLDVKTLWSGKKKTFHCALLALAPAFLMHGEWRNAHLHAFPFVTFN